MTQKISGTFAPLVWVLSTVLMIAGVLPGLSVCIAADGRIQLKASCGCVAGASWESTSKRASHHLTSLERYRSDDSCGPCSDIPISVSTDVPTVPAKATAFQAKEPVPASFSFSVPPAVETASGGFLPRPPPALDSIRASLRTVVLLC